MRVTALRVYPVKSLGGMPVARAAVEPWGLAGDRRWCLLDVAGNRITAREVHDLLGLRAEPVGQGTIRITDQHGASIQVMAPPHTGAEPIEHERLGVVRCAAAEASAWLTARVGRATTLVWQPDPTTRPIAENRGGLPGEHLSLADAGPLLLVSEASLTQLDRWIAAEADVPDVADLDPRHVSGGGNAHPEPLNVVRFRPNVVVDGGEPFEEDRWFTVRIGEVTFRKTMICDRCVMPTIDPVTLAGGKEPTRTLARHRHWDRKTWFGIRLAPLGTGTLSVGDAVEPR
ncbi:MOSC domain-containing protein [Parafrigoribacterium mesophilum]|uniref:MOSC domain-containing protein n=1 Tax=Parafrigoribacterium mesophilum TaxID=433646 RepID=UPI0031FBFC35